MEELQFSVKIQATKEKVWDTLWQDETFRQWADIIDPGTYMVGDLKEGNEIQYISAENGYGVTSLVEKLVPGKVLVLRHSADTQDAGTRDRQKEWTGGAETYTLTEKDGVTTLDTAFDVPLQLETYFARTFPKVLDCIKVLAEK